MGHVYQLLLFGVQSILANNLWRYINCLELARVWQPQYGLSGDVNSDGQINILDLVIVGQNFGEGPLIHIQADINGDGLVNVLDLLLVSNMFDIAR